MIDTYIPKHDVHFMCDRHTQLSIKGDYQAKCCACNAMQGCLDKETDEQFDKQIKQFDEERQTALKIQNPEMFPDE